MNDWMITILAWLACGLVCWIVILRHFRPTPLVDDKHRNSDDIPPREKPFSVRDLPFIALVSVPIAVIAPFLLLILLYLKTGKSSGTEYK